MSLPDSHPRMLKRPYSHGELIADGFVHIVAIVAGLIAFAVLFVRITHVGAISDGLAIAIYAASFFLMFGFSLAYNMTPPSPLKWLLRRFDHSSIYLMIAGTYTAAFSQMGDRVWAWSLIAIVWTVSLFGIALKLFLPGRFDRTSVVIYLAPGEQPLRRLGGFDRTSVVIYLALGWIAVIAIKPLINTLPQPTLILIAVGGMLYTVGVVFYKWHSLKFQNAIWHGFVATAAGFQYAGIAYAVGRAAA